MCSCEAVPDGRRYCILHCVSTLGGDLRASPLPSQDERGLQRRNQNRGWKKPYLSRFQFFYDYWWLETFMENCQMAKLLFFVNNAVIYLKITTVWFSTNYLFHKWNGFSCRRRSIVNKIHNKRIPLDFLSLTWEINGYYGGETSPVRAVVHLLTGGVTLFLMSIIIFSAATEYQYCL